MSKAYINILLNNHMPFVKDLETSEITEERFLFENLTDSQIPLLRMLHRLEDDHIPVSLTLSFSGTMLSMLSDPIIKKHYESYLNKLISLGEEEISRLSDEGLTGEKNLATFYRDRYKEILNFYKEIEGDLLSEYSHFAEKGMIELVASSATHAFLPNYQSFPFSVDLQVKLGLDLFKKTFKESSTGFWLPECGYFPQLETFLKKNSASYFFLDSHAVLLSDHNTAYGPYFPIKVNSVNAFVRDPYLQQFFSSAPSSYTKRDSYRDYYQDIGFDLPLEDLKGFLGSRSLRINTGYKYYSVSSETNKEVYDIEKASFAIEEDVEDFIRRIESYKEKIDPFMDGNEPIFNILSEADLFGQWWYEGIDFLELFFRKISSHSSLQATTPCRYLLKYEAGPFVSPIHSSWGKNGFSEPWLNNDNDWICRLNHDMIEKLEDLINRYYDTNSFQQKKMILQAVKEVLLAQSSDWPFMIWEGHHVSYATNRVKEHFEHFDKICNYLTNSKYDVSSFIEMEKKYNLMPDLSIEDLINDRK